MEYEYRKPHSFDYNLFMDTEDYISINDFSKEDQRKILEYNGCGEIIFYVKTKNKYFKEVWLFNNKEDKLIFDEEKLIPIWPYNISSTCNLELVADGELEDIQLSFEPYTKEMIEEILEQNQKDLDNHLAILSISDEMEFSEFDDDSQKLFKEYAGKGLIIRTVYSRLGRTFQEEWEFDSVEREVMLKDLQDDTLLQINSESLDNRLNLEFYPEQDFLKVTYSFKPFLEEEYKSLSVVEDFVYDEYMKNYYEIIEGYCFTDEDYKLIKKYKTKGLIFYEFKTIYNEIIRDYYEINNMYKHDINEELKKLATELDLEKFTNEEIDEIKKDYDFYDFEVIPFKLGERNNFTVPEIEKFGSGNWYYQKDKKINE